MPCHDDGRTHCAPTRSLGTNLPPAQSPRDRDDELPLLTLHSWLQSITTINCLTDAVALTDTVDLSRESARHRELSGSQRQFIGFDFLLYAARELIENGKKILFG
jgi:hypothetical protein